MAPFRGRSHVLRRRYRSPQAKGNGDGERCLAVLKPQPTMRNEMDFGWVIMGHDASS